ncbi:Alkaline phosphatase, tissue-nonspecific isozyme [Chionoecetes opilio]|uniref:alkaline phosphatase n=1 Tax=Chionoecetes opilio TaxID=41210 RepID=A0A8J4YGY5_CHIOP|nr:Alkaline phosphatase, tissue-nonspecific isozyme [Chionoecetes opilio]
MEEEEEEEDKEMEEEEEEEDKEMEEEEEEEEEVCVGVLIKTTDICYDADEMARAMEWTCLRVLLLLLVGTYSAESKLEGRQHWWNVARNELSEALSMRDNWGVAKNVIMFLGDGMGITANTAGRIFKGQQLGFNGEEGYLTWERFPNAALVKVKRARVGQEFLGIVTTTRITHATPGATYAHAAHRNWECDSEAEDGCSDIAHQLVHDNPGKNVKVILGGGRQAMGVNSEMVDALTCSRNDSRDLTEEWFSGKVSEGHKARYVTTARGLAQVDPEKTDYLLGLFADSHLPYEVDRKTDTPSLKDMTLKALRFLRKSDEGFFLLVEGGRIDHALHENLPHRALEEVVALDAAVAAALKEVDLEETLVVVTADHSHVMTINGYPNRGNDILGLVGENSEVDGLPYTTLMFTNGPGYNYTVKNDTVVRHDPSTVDTRDLNYRFQAGVPMPPFKETHGGEDVGLWAAGPMSHLFHRTHEQHYIAHAMAYAACIGPSLDDCKRPSLDSSSGGRRPRRYTTLAPPLRTTASDHVTVPEEIFPTEQHPQPTEDPKKAGSSPSISVIHLGPKFPTLSPILQKLFTNNKEKILTSRGTQTLKSFTNEADVRQLLGRTQSPSTVHGV